MIDWTPLLRVLAARRVARLDRLDPVATQRATLAALLRRARHTRFGREHDFAGIRDVETYQARIKLRDYEAFWTGYWQESFPRLQNVTWPGRMPYFAQSSGTTSGVTKRIPVSRATLRANAGAAFDTLAFHLVNRPQSRVLGGMTMLLGGSAALDRLAPGVRAGDLSGIAAAQAPRWIRPRTLPPRDLARIGNWEAKVAALAPASLRYDVRNVSGTPSWMLLFFDQLAALHPDRPRRLAAFYPNLELIVHGGVAFTPYADSMAAWLAGSHAETREVYAASEGFIACADRGPGEGMRLVLDRGLFFEFVRPAQLGDAAPDRRWLGNAELGVEYALVLTTNAGLWSYVIGDTVTLVDRTPPRLLVTGRTSFTLSALGEHVIAQELDAAVRDAARSVGGTVADYAAAPLYPGSGRALGGHLFIVELSPPPPPDSEAEFGRVVDQVLARLNADYAEHRRDGFGMAPPEVRFAPPGAFAGWMRARGKSGAQNKVPRVINDPALLRNLLAFLGDSA